MMTKTEVKLEQSTDWDVVKPY